MIASAVAGTDCLRMLGLQASACLIQNPDPRTMSSNLVSTRCSKGDLAIVKIKTANYICITRTQALFTLTLVIQGFYRAYIHPSLSSCTLLR